MTPRETAGIAAATTDASTVAHQIMSEIAGAPAETRPQLLLERALAVAAAAQQTLADQRQRIAELEALSVTDELTGLANRRGFSLALKHTLSTLRRHGGEAALIVLDLDDFKAVNDTFGHAAGDHILLQVSQILRQHVRDTDTVARLGGDEFALLLPGAPPDLARYRASALTQMVARAVARWRHMLIPIAASVGVTQVTAVDDEAGVLERADRSMYRTKRERSAATALVIAHSAVATSP